MKAWEITKKDLRLLLRDRRTVVLLILMPLIFITILGITTGQLMVWGDEKQNLQVAIVDNVAYEQITAEDDGRQTFTAEKNRRNARMMIVEIVEMLQERDGLLVQLMDEETARKYVNDGDAHAAIIFGPDFYKRVSKLTSEDILDTTRGALAEGLTSVDLQVYSRSPGSGRTSIIEDTVYIYTIRAIAPFVSCKHNLLRLRIKETCDEYEAPVEQTYKELHPKAAAEKPKNDTSTRGSTVYQDLVPSYTVMFVFFIINIMARSFLQEKDLGTLRRLRIAPLGSPSLLSGKTVPFFLVSLVQSAILFLVGRLLFDMSWGTQPLLLLPVIAATSLSATALGLLVATSVRTDSQVSAYSNLIVLTAAGISGCFMPRDWLPPLLQKISYGTPHAWSLIAYDQILQNPTPNLTTIWQCVGMLCLFSLGFFLLGCLRFRSST